MSADRRPDEPRACDLCGLPVKNESWVLQTPERRYAFCCEGCQGIFRLLHDPEVVSDPGTSRS